MSHTIHRQAQEMAAHYRKARLNHKSSRTIWKKLVNLTARALRVEMRTKTKTQPAGQSDLFAINIQG